MTTQSTWWPLECDDGTPFQNFSDIAETWRTPYPSVPTQQRISYQATATIMQARTPEAELTYLAHKRYIGADWWPFLQRLHEYITLHTVQESGVFTFSVNSDGVAMLSSDESTLRILQQNMASALVADHKNLHLATACWALEIALRNKEQLYSI